MVEKYFYSPVEFFADIKTLADKIRIDQRGGGVTYKRIYGVPRGGWLVALALSYELDLEIVAELTLNNETLIVDDVVDSGATLEQYYDLGTFVCIHKKPHCSMEPDIFVKETDKWIVYFWERQETEGVADNVTRLLQYIGENPARQGLLETPKRVVKAYDSLFSGYKMDPASIVKTFDETDGYDEMIWLNDIEVYSMCEHHMLPFVGRAHVAYVPKDGRVIGVSKLARLVEVFARRLQIQERLTSQITEALMTYLKPHGAACVIEAQHLCMTMRGIQKQNAYMTTSSLKGVFIEKPEVRQEFMNRIKRFKP